MLPAAPRSAPVLARLAAVALLALGLVLAVPGTAAAHTALRGTDPAADGTVTTPLPAVTLTFTARVLGGEVTVTGPDGTPVGTGEVVHDGAVLTAPVTLAAAGRHTVTWSAVADDGHALDGTFAFEHAPATPLPEPAAPAAAAPPAAETTPATDPADPTTGTDTDTASAPSGAGGPPGWALPAAAVAVLAAGALAALRSRGRRG